MTVVPRTTSGPWLGGGRVVLAEWPRSPRRELAILALVGAAILACVALAVLAAVVGVYFGFWGLGRVLRLVIEICLAAAGGMGLFFLTLARGIITE